MTTYVFWDIENVSIHNLAKIMDRVRAVDGDAEKFAVYSKIKESRTVLLIDNGWTPVRTEGIFRNSADTTIKRMIESVLEQNDKSVKSIIIITEDKGFRRISERVIRSGISLEIICGTKSPAWIQRL